MAFHGGYTETILFDKWTVSTVECKQDESIFKH